MNVTKIAALRPFFLDMLRTQAAQPHRSLLDMLEIKLRTDLLLANGKQRLWVAVRDLENPVQRFDQLGLPTDDLLLEFVPARVWAWAEQQLPADPGDEARWLAPRVGFEVRLSASTKVEGLPGQPVPQDAPSVYLLRQGPAEEFAGLLRGIRAYQVKRRKRARRLLAQLRAHHAQQQRQLAIATALAERTTVPTAPTHRRADARAAVGVLLGYGATTVKRLAHSVGVAVGCGRMAAEGGAVL